ncbi:3682_t:CDS:2, partial [Scutellospora calospora]
ICSGLRPEIPAHVPKLISELIVKCWDDKPENRPFSEKLYNTLVRWHNEILNQTSTEFTTQIRKADEVSEYFPIPSPSNIEIYSESRFVPLNIENSDNLFITQVSKVHPDINKQFVSRSCENFTDLNETWNFL